jgi:prepilin-type N-terminal cleavage/methylation domain-containing protein
VSHRLLTNRRSLASRRLAPYPVPTGVPTGPGRSGFTLIELLIVVGIISVLAAIAVPNFLEAQTRSKVSRIKNDMRTMATALEAYYGDYNRYPPRTKFPAGATILGIGIVQSDANCTTGCRVADLKRLTTPIAYITSPPKDVFENAIAPPNDLIDYYEPILVDFLVRGTAAEYVLGKTGTFEFGWALMSVGPDKVFGATSLLGNYPPRTLTTSQTWRQEYDPTNGTISNGNIYRFHKAGATGNDAFTPRN